MGLPVNDIQPDHLYTYPSRKPYWDESKSTLANGTVTDPAKTGKDYSITDPKVTKVTKAATTGTTNGG